MVVVGVMVRRSLLDDLRLGVQWRSYFWAADVLFT